jgi:hypothetical protein
VNWVHRTVARANGAGPPVYHGPGSGRGSAARWRRACGYSGASFFTMSRWGGRVGRGVLTVGERGEAR